MKRAHALFAVLVALVFFGYRPVTTLISGRSTSAEPASCDYEGRSYRLEEQRRADDGCNVCACGENGWTCTKISCMAGGAGNGSISGALSYPSETLPAQRVCATNLADDKEYCQQTKQGDASFVITAPIGDYWVYAALEGDTTGKRAYFSEFVTCGLKAECKDHTPVKVAVESQKISAADPQDWYAPGQVAMINVSPSRFEYYTHNYYPSSVFRVTSQGFSKVELSSTPYPPLEGAPFSPIGEATLVSEERGIQVWTMPVPAGFQAMQVRAKGTSESGDFLLSREIRLVRPIETASENSKIE